MVRTGELRPIVAMRLSTRGDGLDSIKIQFLTRVICRNIDVTFMLGGSRLELIEPVYCPLNRHRIVVRKAKWRECGRFNHLTPAMGGSQFFIGSCNADVSELARSKTRYFALRVNLVGGDGRSWSTYLERSCNEASFSGHESKEIDGVMLTECQVAERIRFIAQRYRRHLKSDKACDALTSVYFSLVAGFDSFIGY